MAKQRHTPTQETSSKGTLAALALGAVLVAGLVAWALTRTVDRPASPPSVMDTVETASAPTATVDTTAFVPPVTPPAPNISATGDIVTSTQAPPQGDRGEVQRMSAEDLRDRMKSGNVVVVDTRDANSFEGSHIPGAINIPMASIEANLDRLPKDKEIVAYCT
ncbi:MAG TPA: rhodanese-like domain-containing protein [Thermoanaerobaculia bacterium]|nr:rhodanese-like domain-containing protein [Thermoanaerobaculia bacterium]